jgi:rubrerythrin
MFSILEIIDIAIQLEKNGEKVYRQAARQVADDELTKMLTWFADEEIRHADFFSSLKKGVEEDASEHFDEEMSRELIVRFVKEQMFSLKEVDFTLIDDLDELLNIFIEFEEDTLLFFEMLHPFVTNSKDSKKMDQIINEEKSHIKQLHELKENMLSAEHAEQ